MEKEKRIPFRNSFPAGRIGRERNSPDQNSKRDQELEKPAFREKGLEVLRAAAVLGENNPGSITVLEWLGNRKMEGRSCCRDECAQQGKIAGGNSERGTSGLKRKSETPTETSSAVSLFPSFFWIRTPAIPGALFGGRNCTHGAGAGTSAAFNAGIWINLHVIISHGDCTDRADSFTGTAADASVVNCICHDVTPPDHDNVRTALILSKTSGKSNSNFLRKNTITNLWNHDVSPRAPRRKEG